MPSIVAGPDDKVDLVSKVLSEPVKRRIHQSERRVALAIFVCDSWSKSAPRALDHEHESLGGGGRRT